MLKNSQALDVPCSVVQRDPRSLPKGQYYITGSQVPHRPISQNRCLQQTMYNFVQTTQVLCVLAFNQGLAAISGQTAYTSGAKGQSYFSFKNLISYTVLNI